jgi:CubicO group peptidase (beta-lactamase class C family)
MIRKNSIAFASVLALLFPLTVLAANDAAVQALLTKFKEETASPGVALSVMQDGAMRYDLALGLADLEQQVPMTGATAMRVGSISKTMTAVAAVRLAHAGRLNLDRPVGEYLTGFDGPARVTTARQLAGHIAGVRGYTKTEDVSYRHYASTREALKIFANDPLVSPPGESYRYSSAGYTLLSAVLAAVAGRPFEKVVARQVWGPLGMRSTGLDDVRRIFPGRARFYVKDKNGAVQNGLQIDNSFKWAGAGMLSSTHDLAKFGAALLGTDFLAAEEKAELFSRGKTNDGAYTAYGLGWYVDMEKFLSDRQDHIPAPLYDRLMAAVAGRSLIWHSGTAEGAVSVLMMEPRRGLVLALAVNMGDVEKETVVAAIDLLTGMKSE